MPLLPEDYYAGLDRPYQTSHSMLLLGDALDAKINQGDVEIWRKEITYTDAKDGTVSFTEMQTWCARFPKSKAFAVFVGIPSPTGTEGSGHAVALYIDLKNSIIHYQDPHGLPMPKPLLAGLQNSFEGFTIYNHYVVQQTRGDLSCAAITIQNLVGFAHCVLPAHAPDILAIRRAQLPFLTEIIRDENRVKELADEKAGPQSTAPSRLKIKSVSIPSAEEIAATRAAFWAHAFPHTAPEKIDGTTPRPTVYKSAHRPAHRPTIGQTPAKADSTPSG